MSRTLSAPVLVHAIGDHRESRQATLAIRAAGVIFMTLLTAAAAQVSFSIPFTTIPFTMQPMVVLIAGMALGPRLGMASQLLYLAAGIAGLPVFAVSATLPMGAARLLGPSGGYLLAYPFAAFVTGWLASRGFDRRYWTSLLAMAAGLLLIYACGVTWLALLSSPIAGQTAIGFNAALAAGFYPFVVADILKIVLAAGLMPALWKLLR
jgi:biotin transport system substrate-specific component